MIKSNYSYEAQEDNEISFEEGQILELLHKIDDDWWLARSRDDCYGMVPANYFEGDGQEVEQAYKPEEQSYEEPEEQAYEPEEQAYEPEKNEIEEQIYYEDPVHDKSYNEPEPVNYEEEETFVPPPPPPLPKNPVENLQESSFLKFKCDALFLNSMSVKCKGQLLLEKALYLCSSDSVENVYDLSDLRDYDAVELKMTLKSGDKVAIGLGKKDAKKFSELVKEISGYDPSSVSDVKETPLPKAPIVVGPKMPESPDNKKSEEKVPMMVGVSFEGLEGEEVSIFEGEEVYMLNDSVDSNPQFSRIEKINGVQGIVPRNFLMSRSEYQKKVEEQKKFENEKVEIEEKISNMKINESPVMGVKPKVPSAPIATNNSNSNALARSASKNSPWSALASGSIPKQQQPQTSKCSSVKLENSRLWKDKTGKFQVEAEFVSLSDGKVTILKTSGSQVSVPLEVLSEKDIEYACKRAGIAVPKTKSTGNTVVKGFDWSAFLLSVGIEVDKAKEFGEKFASQSFEKSMIAAFTSDFLSAQGMQMTEIYKILPEAAKRKAQAMQSAAKEKHRSNNSQMVLRSPEIASSQDQLSVYEGNNAPKTPQKSYALTQAKAPETQSVEIEKFPTIEELEAQGAIEVSKSSVTLPNGISVSKASNDHNDNTRVLVQPINGDIKERTREVVGADGSTAKEYTRISSSTVVEPLIGGSSAIALMQQQQAQQNAMIQMRMQAQAQAQAQMQMQIQMRAQAQAQAQAQYMAAQQQQRMYQMQQQQQAAPTVHITIHTGEKSSMNPNPSVMTPPLSVMNQPMMQMNNQMGMNPMIGGVGGVPMSMNPLNPMNTFNPMNSNPFDPNFYPNGNGYPF